MNRVEIKKLSKSKIKGNKWNILWPILVIEFLESVVERIFHLDPLAGVDFTNLQSLANFNIPTSVSIKLSIISIIFGVILVAYNRYVLNFVRTGKFEFNDIIDCLKEKWLNILISYVLTTLIVFVCSLLFVVPGIIIFLAYGVVTYVVIDTDLSAIDSMKKSRAMMKGYKWNYFVFILSFIGWILLVPFTFGILLIWLVPYMVVADCIYYERLREITKE